MERFGGESMPDDPDRYAVVLTTAGSEEEGKTLAEALVLRRLAACVNMLPHVASVYRWKGEISRDHEVLLVIKTSERLFPAVREAIRELHSYELPEILMLPITNADPGILAWLRESLADPAKT